MQISLYTFYANQVHAIVIYLMQIKYTTYAIYSHTLYANDVHNICKLVTYIICKLGTHLL